MHPAVPIATQFLTEHTHRIVGLLEQRQQQNYGLRLAAMLQEVISHTTAAITEKQIEAILLLTKQTHGDFAKNLDHYMAEREKYTSEYLATKDLLLRAEITRHIKNIDHQMNAIRSDMEALHNFSANLIRICGEAGLDFVRDLSVPYTAPRQIG
jgi:hypothetical protein